MASFFPRTTRDWNELPNTTVNTPSVEAFKNCLRATVPSEPSAIYTPLKEVLLTNYSDSDRGLIFVILKSPLV